MKKVLCVLTILLLISACGDKITKNTMTVSGQIKGLKKGTLYLQHVSDSTLVVLDSLVVNGDGSFSFKNEIESPEIFYLYLNKNDGKDFNDRITFFGEPGTITINTSWNAFDSDAKITGSETHEKLEAYQKNMSKFDRKNFELFQQSTNSEIPLNAVQLDSLQRESDKNTRRAYLFAINHAINNKDSYLAPYIAINDIPNTNIKYLDTINNSLTPEIAESKYGKKLKKLISKIKN